MPAMRLSTTPAPTISAPNNTFTTTGRYMTNTKPIAASPAEAMASTRSFISKGCTPHPHSDRPTQHEQARRSNPTPCYSHDNARPRQSQRGNLSSQK